MAKRIGKIKKLIAVLGVAALIAMSIVTVGLTFLITVHDVEVNGIEPHVLDLSCGELEAKINSLLAQTGEGRTVHYRNMYANEASAYLKVYELKHCPAP